MSWKDALGWLRGSMGPREELAARLAYAQQRRRDLAAAPDAPDEVELELLDARLSLARQDGEAGRFDDMATTLNELDERLAQLEDEAEELAEARATHQARVDALSKRVDEARARLDFLSRAGIGSDGLAMLRARVDRVQGTSAEAALPAAEAELASVEEALARLRQRARNHLTQN